MLFVFCSGAVPSYSSHSQENEIHLDFSKPVQRVGVHAFLNEQLFLHAEALGFSRALFVVFVFIKLIIWNEFSVYGRYGSVRVLSVNDDRNLDFRSRDHLYIDVCLIERFKHF